MKTDIEILKEMFAKAQIPFIYKSYKDETQLLEISGGYAGFVTDFTFTKEGNLLDVQAYE